MGTVVSHVATLQWFEYPTDHRHEIACLGSRRLECIGFAITRRIQRNHRVSVCQCIDQRQQRMGGSRRLMQRQDSRTAACDSSHHLTAMNGDQDPTMGDLGWISIVQHGDKETAAVLLPPPNDQADCRRIELRASPIPSDGTDAGHPGTRQQRWPYRCLLRSILCPCSSCTRQRLRIGHHPSGIQPRH